MNLTRLFIFRPVATLLLTLAILLLGALGYRLLPVAPLPQVDDNLDTFNSGGSGFLDQNNGWDNNYADNNDFNDLGNDSFDGFNDDDDSFV